MNDVEKEFAVHEAVCAERYAADPSIVVVMI